jgi:hypothetical protein
MKNTPYSIAGIPIIVSEYAEKGSISLLPNFDEGNPIIVTDSMMTMGEKLEEWFKVNKGKFAIIRNIGEGK